MPKRNNLVIRQRCLSDRQVPEGGRLRIYGICFLEVHARLFGATVGRRLKSETVLRFGLMIDRWARRSALCGSEARTNEKSERCETS